jgi:hypothetical protein
MNYPKNRYTGEKPWMNYDWLYNEYVVKDKGSQDIADEYGCKQSTINVKNSEKARLDRAFSNIII